MAGGVRQWRLLGGLLLVAMLIASGCTTLQSTQLPPDELRDGIRDGSLVKLGDEISVVTTDGREHLFDVRGVDQDAIRGELADGEEAVVAIDDVVALRTHQTERIRTSYAVLGGIGAGGIGGFFLLLLILYV